MVRIATADVAVHADTAPFVADLEKLKAVVEKFDKLSVAVHAKLAKGTRASLQAQLKALAPPLTVNVKAKLTGLGELRRIISTYQGILSEENQLNQALQEEAKARKEIANAAAAASRQAAAAFNAEAAQLRNEALKARLAKQQAAEMARQTRIARDMKNILGIQLREWRFLGQQVFGFSRNLDVTRKAFLLNAAAQETLLAALTRVFKRAVDLRRVATTLGSVFAASFAGAAQATGALISGLGRVVSSISTLAGIGLITIGVRILIKNDAEVQASLNNLKSTFTNVFLNATASLKPVVIGFFNDLSAGLNKQQAALTGFFDKVSGPLGRVGKVFSDLLASEQFTNFINKAGDATAGFLNKLADKLPGFINGVVRVSKTLVDAGKRIREAFGPSFLSGLSFDKVVNGINAVTDALVSAGAGVRAFKTAFGQVLGGLGIALKNILATVGQVGPALFGALGPILRAFVIDIGQVISAMIRFASVVLPIAKTAVIDFADSFAANLSKALDILAKPLGETVKNISELGAKMSPILPILAQIAADLEPVVSGIVRLGIAISPFIVELGRFIEKLAAGAAGPLKIFVDALVKIADVISSILTPVLKFLNDHGITDFIGKIAGSVIGVLAFIAVMKSLGGVVGLFTKKDKAKTAALLAENGAMGKGSKLARLFKGALSALGDAAKTVGKFFKKLIPDSVLNKLGSIGTKLLDQIKNPFTAIRLQLFNLQDAFAKFGPKISGAFSSVGKFFGDIGSKIGSAFSSVGKFFTDLGSKIAAPFEGIGEKITSKFAAVRSFFSDLGGKISGAFEGIGAKIGAAFESIGAKLKAPFEGVINFVRGIGSKIAGVFKGFSFAKIFGGLGEAAGPLGKILGTAGRLLGVFGKFLGPIGIIITIITEWSRIMDYLKAQLDNVKQLFSSLGDAFGKIGEGFKKIFSGDIIGGLKDIGSGILTALEAAFTFVFNSLKNTLSLAWNILWDTLESIPILGGFFAKLHGIITTGFNFLKNIFTGAGSFFSTVWDGLVAGASAAWNFIKGIFAPVISFFSSVFSGIGTIIGGVWDFIKSVFSAGVSFIGSIISGIVQFFSNPIEGIKTIISGAWDFIKSIFSAGVAFIGTVFSGIGTIVQGVWDFVVSIFSAGVSIVGSILSGIGSFFSAAFDGAVAIVSGVWDFIKGLFSGGLSFIQGILSGIGGFFSSAFDTVKSVVSGAIDFIKGIIEGVVGTISKIADKVKSIFSSGDSKAAAPQVDQAAVNAAADQVRQQSEAILAALKELAPKVQAELANVTAIISAGFANLGTTIGAQTVGIATQVGAALTGLAVSLTTVMTGLATNLLTQLTALSATLTTQLTTTIATALTTMTTTFSTIGTSLTATFTTIFSDLGNQATAFFTGTFPNVVQGGMAGFQANLTSGMSAAFQGAFSAIGPVISGALDSAFASAVGSAQSGIAAIVGTINGGVGDIAAAFNPLVAQLPQPIADGFAAAVQAANTGVNDLVAAAKAGVDRVRALGPDYFNAGAYIGQQLADGMNSKVEAVRQAANNLAAAAAAPMPHSPAKEGPLSGRGDPMYSGHAIVERLVAGIEQRRGLVTDVVNKVAAQINEGAARANIGIKAPTANAAVNRVLDQIRNNQDPLAAAIDRLNVTLGTLPQNLTKGLQVGIGGGGVAGTALTGRFDRSIKGSILKQDTSAAFGGDTRSVGGNLVQIRPGQINLTLAGIRDPKSFLDELSRELLTMVKGH